MLEDGIWYLKDEGDYIEKRGNLYVWHTTQGYLTSINTLQRCTFEWDQEHDQAFKGSEKVDS